MSKSLLGKLLTPLYGTMTILAFVVFVVAVTIYMIRIWLIDLASK